jgi:2-amino-4-hydroxy-6-hydroxymethyldihydropteridine diphosphokinase
LKRVFLALGSNIGDREANLRKAIEALRAPDFEIVSISPVYETAPQGYANQGWFLNLVLEAQTTLLPLRLLARCQKVERSLGRKREIVNGPRTIDVDVLFYGNSAIRGSGLQVPHPRYAERRFVLAPLVDIAPDLRDPVTHRAMRELLPKTEDQPIRKTEITFSAPHPQT